MDESIIEVIDRLNEITRLQAEVINDLFVVLAQHMTVDELDNLPVVTKINEVAAIRKEISGIGGI